MSILNNAKKHYTSQMAGELASIEVPEWDATVYYRRTINFAQQENILNLHNKGKLAEALVETLIVKALNKDGTRMFKTADRDVLMHEVDPDVILRVCTEINKANADSVYDDKLGN